MRSNESLLLDMLLSAETAKQFIEGMNREQFEISRLHQSAVIRELEIIGEAARNLPQDFKELHPQVEWVKISGLRNRIVHAYFAIDLLIIWEVLQNDLDTLIGWLKQQIPPDEETKGTS